MSSTQVTVLGAAGEVTGSCYLLETHGKRILLDFGLFQGAASVEKMNIVPPQIASAAIDAVVLTHAHLDHVGRLPLLARADFKAPIYGTDATFDFARLVLMDSARLQEADAERDNRRLRPGEKPSKPLYGIGEVEAISRTFRAVEYNRPFQVAPNISARFVDAGHMLGSGSVEFTIGEGAEQKTIVFSGDIGPRGAAFLEDPVILKQADLAFVESTYGNRDHRPLTETLNEAEQIVRNALARRAKILVPAFAIGRTQQILYYLAAAFRDKRLPIFPIYVDSPMAIQASKLYGEHVELFDPIAQELAQSGQLKHDLESVQACQTVEESKALNHKSGPCMIMAGSGMCNGGRIVHHLKHNLSNPNNAVIIVGYQSHGSLGRRLVDGDKIVRIHGEEVAVKATIHTLGGFSAHAGQTELLDWVRPLAKPNCKVVLTHGEDDARKVMREKIKTEFGLEAAVPKWGEVFRV